MSIPVRLLTKKNAFALLLFLSILTLLKLKFSNFIGDVSVANDDHYAEKKYDLSGKEVSEFAPVKVTVYYETMCPDSRNFFVSQLSPTYDEISHLILLDLVPYGKAQTTKVEGSDKYEFSCQHGAEECYGNKLHACAINLIQNQPVLLKVLTCMISKSFSPDDNIEACIKPSGINLSAFVTCAKSLEGDKLLNYYGERTLKERPYIYSDFIPTILLNEESGGQQLKLKNLKREICAQFSKENLPDACS